MPDQRLIKLAKVLVQYSLEIKPGEQFYIHTSPHASELTLAVYEEALKAGAHPTVNTVLPGIEEIYYRSASDEQLDFVSPVQKLIAETFDVRLIIGAEYNTRRLSGIDPKRIARSHIASAPLFKLNRERFAQNKLKWCYTELPTQATAQEAEMSLSDYEEFVYGAGMLHLDDPVAFWRVEGDKQSKLAAWLAGHDQVVLKGKYVDLTMSIQERTFVGAAGKLNFPDGEIYTGPVEESVNGWIRFKYPAIHEGQEVTDIELWFEQGKVVKEKASKNQEFLTTLLDSDPGARYLGEWGIGTNYGIQKFTKNILFDEKIGGTIHLALGASLPGTGGKNDSSLHWDMLCDMADAEIAVDGELFYKNGKPVVE
ncbi:MAG: aminopeptidase [Caldilineaceae bacterium]